MPDKKLWPSFQLPIFKYDALIRYYQETFGNSNVLVLPLEMLRDDFKGFITRLASFSGIDSKMTHELKPRPPVNVGLSGLGIEIGRRLNVLFSLYNFNPIAGFIPQTIRKLVSGYFYRLDRFTVEKSALYRSISRKYESRMRKQIEKSIENMYENSNLRTQRLISIDLASLGYRMPDGCSL